LFSIIKLNNKQIRKIISLILDEGQDKKVVTKQYGITMRKKNQIIRYLKNKGKPLELD